MKIAKMFALPCMVLSMASFVAVAHATPSTYQIKVLTVGSSVQFGVFAEAAYQLATTDGQARHYTLRAGDGSPDHGSGGITDGRTGFHDYGDLWVVWSETTGNIWAYLSVDSVAGVRAFQGVPRATLWLNQLADLPVSTTTNLFVWDDGSNDTALNSGVYAAISGGKQFTAANTDIRPGDALFASRRALASLNTTDYSGLGYGSNTGGPPSGGSAILSNGAGLQRVFPFNFALSFSSDSFGGKDPFTGLPVPPFITIPVGAAPILFIANTSNASGLGASSFNNITSSQALKLFSGLECDAT